MSRSESCPFDSQKKVRTVFVHFPLITFFIRWNLHSFIVKWLYYFSIYILAYRIETKRSGNAIFYFIVFDLFSLVFYFIPLIIWSTWILNIICFTHSFRFVRWHHLCACVYSWNCPFRDDFVIVDPILSTIDVRFCW